MIGYGYMGRNYHAQVVLNGSVPFVPTAVYDIDPKRLENAAKDGWKTYDRLDAFLASKEFDVVTVVPANNYHCELACEALEADYHVLCEKTAAMNITELKKMIQIAEKCGKIFTVHQNRRWDEDYQTLKKALSENHVGKPYLIESRIFCKNTGDMYGWRGMRDHGGGMLFDWGVHALNQLLLWLCYWIKPSSHVYLWEI